jgi:uncharacterized membrane protein
MRRPTLPGVVVGTVFWWFSLVPSLLPRSWAVQAAVSAVCIGIGYALGTLLGWFVRQFRPGRPPLTAPLTAAIGRRLPERTPVWAPVAVAVAVVVVIGCAMWVRWQNQQRPLVSMEPVAAVSTVPMVLLTIVLTFVLVMIGRLVGGAVRRLDRWNRRHLPDALAVPTTIILVIVIGGFLLRDVVADTFVDWADRTFSIADEGTTDGTVQPTEPTASGSPDSLVEWDDLGLQGRDFVAGATSEEELREFASIVGADPDDVMPPIRAYAGIDSASDLEERAQLVVDDLVRAGAFEREVLVVATSTGTGWIDPDASRALELMYGGDTAIASMQYSFLPSWISFLVDLDRASSAGAELFAAVHDEWSTRPPDDRPRLIAFGLSLGSFGQTAAFTGQEADTSVANIVGQTDGALFVGSPYATELLRQLVDERDAGSPAWAPVIDDGETVRFETRDPDQPRPGGSWDTPRVLLVQHPSDPVVHWYYDWVWRPPEWMDAPRGYDVPAEASWFPIVTGVQGVFDLMAGFSAPPGYGHDYRLDYPDSWAAVVPPAGWTEADTTALEDYAQQQRDAASDG